MSKSPKNRKPKAQYSPLERQPFAKENPGSTDKETPAWQFHRCDKDHLLWGWNKMSPEKYLEVIKALHGFEQMTWANIKAQSGGKASGRGTNHHFVPVSNFVKEARQRLEELILLDYEELFSLRLNSTLRLYAVKEGRILRFIWHDPYHGDDKGACPVAPK